MTAGEHALTDLLPVEAIRLHQHASDWKDAVRLSGVALAASGATTEAYIDEMIAVVEELGPYIVIAPGLALAHARPSPAVHRPGLSWVTLTSPVEFGHPQNDPVDVVVGLAAPSQESHVTALATLAELLSDEDRRTALVAAREPDEVRDIIAGFQQQADDQ